MGFAIKNTITVDEVNSIRKSMGWRQLHPKQLKAGLDGSQLIISVYTKENTAVGMTRLIWDGGSVAMIPSILIVPEYQNQGIEEELLTLIFDFLRGKLEPGYGIQLDIRVWNNQETFYENMGFQISTPQRRGIPMHICLTNQIELTDKKFKQMDYRDQ